MNMNSDSWNEEKLAKCIGRTDTYALQLKTGAYVPIHKNVGKEVLSKHLNGEHTIGSYVISEDGTSTYGVIDIDGDKNDLEPLKRLGETIYSLFPDFSRVLEFSGRRGYHVWIFFKNPENPKFIKELIKTRLKTLSLRNIEIFPKQDSLEGKKLGNLIKVPLGKHMLGGWSTILKEEWL